MTWEDHVVECRNKDGRVAKFVHSKNVSSGEYTGSQNGPWKTLSETTIFANYYNSGWDHDTETTHRSQGWDLRPLEMHKNKPYPEAVLAYNPKLDQYAWFLHNRYAPEGQLGNKVYKGGSMFKDNIWCVSEFTDKDDFLGYIYTWTEQHVWENSTIIYGGWVFPDGAFETKTKDEVMPKTDELIKKVVKYCSDKAGRDKYLQDLILTRCLNPDESYENVADAITHYINGTNACDDGKKRALKALGLKKETKLVKKSDTVFNICDYIKYDNKVIYSDSNKTHKITYKSNYSGALDSIPGYFVMEYYVEEEV